MSTQRIAPLSEFQWEELEHYRGQMERFIRAEDLEFYPSPGFKLELIRSVLEAGVREPDTLKGMGVLLGDALVADCGFTWVMIRDRHGVELGLFHPRSRLVVFPMDMVRRRVEAGLDFDVVELFREVERQL
ncbi:MAG: DUF3806 domain-containing protein [Candidatus Eremiobacterota bacterium]